MPDVLVVVEQGAHAYCGQCLHDAHDHVRGQLALPIVVTALQHVLQFQLQLTGQPVEPDLLAGQRGFGGEAVGELVNVGSAVDPSRYWCGFGRTQTCPAARARNAGCGRSRPALAA